MFNVLILGLLFVYYWYFYTCYSKPVPKPSTGAPFKAESLKPVFDMSLKHQFTIKVKGQSVWYHMLPKEQYVLSNQKIISKDVCFGSPPNKKIEAKGQALYNYLKNQPDTPLNTLDFHENSTPYTVQEGDVYYFTCMNNRIQQLNICPSGTIFRNGHCLDINMCTGKPDGMKFAGVSITTYFKCKSGRESRPMSCAANQFFYHDRCVRMDDLIHRCKFYSNVPLLLDPKTRIECRDGKPVRVECPPGYRFFDKDYCEPAQCDNQPDGTRLPLPERTVDPFHFKPGYWECLNNKVSQTVECLQTWDDSLSKGDNLTFLPMVFDGNECSVPEFGRNVFSRDPDVLVPVYEFSKSLKNWKFSDQYDRAVGFDNNRKRHILPPDQRISKHFKAEPACEPQLKLGVYQQPNQYYDCDQSKVVTCPTGNEHFDGVKCEANSSVTFNFQNIPIFRFKPLNYQSWIYPIDYANPNMPLCDKPESTIVPLYNICSHPDCESYGFLSMIPELALLLPADQHAKCKFDETTRKLVKENVAFPYRFWDQKLTTEEDKPCTPGQNLQTGNFIWDSTVFATCDPKQPFIFCPSVHSRKLIEFNKVYACAPPDTNNVIIRKRNTLFETGEIARIFPFQWTGQPMHVKLSSTDPFINLDQNGLEIPQDKRVQLSFNGNVRVELRYRFTYPPNVAFMYDDQGNLSFRTAANHMGFIARKNGFTDKPLAFPRYTFVTHIDSMEGKHLV